MFSFSDGTCIGFDSRWKVTRVSQETRTQTDYQSANVGTSTGIKKEIEIQTDAPQQGSGDYDVDKLATFLRNVYPGVKKELDDVLNSQAFKNYHPLLEEVGEYARLFQKVQTNIGGNDVLPISAIAWNCTGYTIAVSCKYEHISWCHHTSFVSFYTFDRNDMLPEVPQKCIKTDSCITCLKFHSERPTILAGGTHTGEIILWNTQNSDEDLVIYRINGHDEPLTQISWIQDVETTKSILLATSSLDGLINLWNYNHAASILKIKLRYKIKIPAFGRTTRKTSVPPEIAKKVERGIIAFDFSRFVPNMFVVAAEGGLVVQCSMLGTKPLLGSNEECPIQDPVYKYYQCHEGEITGIGFSPNRSEMFFTIGSDGEIRAYILDQDEPAKTLFLKDSSECAFWVPHFEKLLITSGSKGIFEVYDIVSGKQLENVIKDAVEPNEITQMQINQKRSTILAIGTKTGELQFWRVPWNVFANKI